MEACVTSEVSSATSTTRPSRGMPPNTEEMLRNIMAKERNLDEVVNEFRRITLQPNNGNHKIIQGEDELLRLLSEGYELVKDLNEDKYIVRHA